MKATWNNKGKQQLVAEAAKEDLIYIEGNWYFPPSSVKSDFLRKSATPYTCPWKGVCQYFDVGQGDSWSADNAWSYPHPKDSAIEIVKKSSDKDFSDYVAFWQDVTVSD
ncbi:MAG: DUF427 domain-containing protein [Candidatus Saccharimonadales bacterium]